MKINDVVIHPKYGKGHVVEIMETKDQVICFLAGENRYFTKAGAEFMIDAASRDKATTGADFDHGQKKVMTEKEMEFIAGRCLFCSKDFEKEQALAVHQSQCKQNPNARRWKRRGKGAQPKNAAGKHLPGAALVGEATHNTLSIPVCPAGRSITSVEITDTPAAIPPPPSAAPARQPFAVSRLYDYLLAGILLSILICGIIYAALGIKLLFGG